MDLTYKQSLFVEAYLGPSAGNATDAARRAGYRRPQDLGPRLVKKSQVRARIDARLAEAAMPANEVLARLSEYASGNLGDFIEVDNAGIWRVDLRKAKRACKLRLLKKLKATKEGTDIELHSPLDALDKLARHHGLYAEKSGPKAEARAPVVIELPEKDLHAGKTAPGVEQTNAIRYDSGSEDDRDSSPPPEHNER